MPPASAGGPAVPGPGALPGSSVPAAHRASLSRRLAALGYEGLLLGAVLLGLGFLLAPAVSPWTGVAAGGPVALPGTTARMLLWSALVGIGGLYFCRSWSGGRRTLPMKTWRIRLARRDGGIVGRRAAIFRYLACWIGPAAALFAYAALRPADVARHAAWLCALNYAWAYVDPDRQFLHDRLAGTRIVFEKQ